MFVTSLESICLITLEYTDFERQRRWEDTTLLGTHLPDIHSYVLPDPLYRRLRRLPRGAFTLSQNEEDSDNDGEQRVFTSTDDM
jgi:hypothetical protein